jgi:tetratricopeptide (TPR) repeat protein
MDPLKKSFVQQGAAIFSLFVLLALVFTTSAKRVDDFDLWWHLKSGERIVQTLAIPTVDAFAYSTITPEQLRGVGIESNPLANPPSDFPYWHANLSNSWFGQVLLYLSYHWGGLQGVGILKSILLTLTCLVLYRAMLRGGADPVVSLMVLTLAAYIGKDFNYSRTQIFSFLFFALEYFLLIDWQQGGRRFFLLPLVFLFWANTHGGYVIGVAVLLLFVFGVVLKSLVDEKISWKIFRCRYQGSVKLLLFVAALSVLVSLANPNGFVPFLLVFAIKKSIFFNGIEEYARPMLYEYHGYWFLLGLAGLIFLIRLKAFDPADSLPVLFLAIASQMGIRAIIFFTLAAAVFVAVNLSAIIFWLKDRELIARLLRLTRLQLAFAAGAPQVVIAIIFLTIFVRTTAQGGIMPFNIVEHTYPKAAVEFVKQNKLAGRMFNAYNWGGYLIWNLPQNQVFIDGRCLNETAFLHYQLIISASEGKDRPNAKPLWQDLLDQYQVDFILTNAVSGDGSIVPLTYQLMSDPGWQAIYQDGTAMVFIRDTPKNRQLYGARLLDKQKSVLDEIFAESQAGTKRYPATWNYYENLGLIYLQRRQLLEARGMFEKYLSMNPNNHLVITNLNVIRRLSGEAPLPLPSSTQSPHHF